MDAISITVRLPSGPTRTYRFEELPLLVGRSPACALAICHEAVPRELCRIWLEDQGRSVRVEELPGLTNPLLVGGRRLHGGATGRRLELAIGPVELDVRPAAAGPTATGGGRRRVRLPLAAAAAIAGLSLIVVLVAPGSPGSAPEGAGFPALPDDPVPPTPPGGCDDPSACRQRSTLLASRARSLLGDPAATPADKVRAAGLLAHSAQLIEEIDPTHGADCRIAARRAARDVLAAYRRERASLKRALERGDHLAASTAARRLRSFLQDHPAHGEARRRLARIVAVAEADGEAR